MGALKKTLQLPARVFYRALELQAGFLHRQSPILVGHMPVVLLDHASVRMAEVPG